MRTRLTRVLGSTAVAMTFLGAGAASAEAGATAGWHHVAGTANADGSWFIGEVVRTKSGTGSVIFNLNNNASGGLCLRLYNARTNAYFTNPVCWAAGSLAQKTLATDVLTGTRFRIAQRKRTPSNTNGGWGGNAWY